jgi:hypothetical protein
MHSWEFPFKDMQTIFEGKYMQTFPKYLSRKISFPIEFKKNSFEQVSINVFRLWKCFHIFRIFYIPFFSFFWGYIWVCIYFSIVSTPGTRDAYSGYSFFILMKKIIGFENSVEKTFPYCCFHILGGKLFLLCTQCLHMCDWFRHSHQNPWMPSNFGMLRKR